MSITTTLVQTLNIFSKIGNVQTSSNGAYSPHAPIATNPASKNKGLLKKDRNNTRSTPYDPLNLPPVPRTETEEAQNASFYRLELAKEKEKTRQLLENNQELGHQVKFIEKKLLQTQEYLNLPMPYIQKKLEKEFSDYKNEKFRLWNCTNPQFIPEFPNIPNSNLQHPPCRAPFFENGLQHCFPFQHPTPQYNAHPQGYSEWIPVNPHLPQFQPNYFVGQNNQQMGGNPENMRERQVYPNPSRDYKPVFTYYGTEDNKKN